MTEITTDSIITDLNNKADRDLLNLSADGLAKLGGGSSRNIGEIIASALPITSDEVHLLDGALIQGDGIYADFVEYISNLDLSANYFCTETEWQQSITDYGVCGKFVYNSTNNTVRLPKITGITEGTTDLTALGDLVEAGLPNITGAGLRGGQDGTVSGAFTKTSTGQSNGAAGNYGANYDFSASRSNSIYGNSATVQPQTIKVLYYIVIATSTKTDIQVDIDEIATDLNGKADVDLTNITDSAKVLMSGMGMPSDTYTDLTLGASGSTYTAPANGYIFLNKRSSGAGQYTGITNYTSELVTQRISTATGQNLPCFLECRQGDSLTVEYTAGGALMSFRFVYAQGSESEAN